METEAAGLAAAGESWGAVLLAAIVESSHDAIIGESLDGVIRSWNAGASAMYGYPPEEMLGHSISELIPADRAGELMPLLDGLRRGERVEPFDTRRVGKDGTVLDVSVSVSPVPDAAGNVVGAASVHRDISERVRAEAERLGLEARLRQAERLETLGQLAGGIAHDFNNLLSVIVGYAGMLADEVGDNPGLRTDVKQIDSAAQRAARLTRQLLIFSRRDTPQPDEADLNAVVADVQELLKASLGGGIDLQFELAVGLPAIQVDRGYVDQVLLNLVVNARDAMPAGGTLTIGTAVAVLDEAYSARHPGIRVGPYVELWVRDNGTGMSPEVMARVFEPLFTTKAAGRGTGLGLATVYGIATRAGGSVSVESEEGAGTVFRVYFPSANVPAPAVPPGAGGVPRRILVVDDEPAVLALAARVLRKSGYEVVEASTGEEALGLASLPDVGVDLLLTDSVLPHMSGAGLAERFAQLQPGVRVLHMSGYSAGSLSAEAIGRRDVAFIEKPFNPQALLDKVRSVLAAPPAT